MHHKVDKYLYCSPQILYKYKESFHGSLGRFCVGIYIDSITKHNPNNEHQEDISQNCGHICKVEFTLEDV